MAKAFTRSEDVRGKLHDTLILIKGQPFWVYYLTGLNILCLPLFDVKDVPKDFFEDFTKSDAHNDYISGVDQGYIIDANSPLVDLSVPDFGYVNVFDFRAKPKMIGTVWTSRRPSRSSTYGIHHQTTFVQSICVAAQANPFHRTSIKSWGDAIVGKFPPLPAAIEVLDKNKIEGIAFDKHFAVCKPNAENPLKTIHYNDTKVAVLGKKLRVLPMWRKPWFEKLLAHHTWMIR